MDISMNTEPGPRSNLSSVFQALEQCKCRNRIVAAAFVVELYPCFHFERFEFESFITCNASFPFIPNFSCISV